LAGKSIELSSLNQEITLIVNTLISNLYRRVTSNISIRRFTIKQLTLLGFAVVALPLVLALIFSAAQVNQLSQQGANSVFSVAALTKANLELNKIQLKMERYASQYLVLKNETLKEDYLLSQQNAVDIVNANLASSSSAQLRQLSDAYIANINVITSLLNNVQSQQTNLELLQPHFISLSGLSQKINLHSNELIANHATQIKQSADSVSQTMLNSLFIIPIAFLLAGIFTVLITKPLKKLTGKIQILEQGNFEQAIKLKGSAEVREIADALEVMRTRLHALELQKSSFIRHISHELKTPLAAIREGTELLYDNSVGELNAEQQEICHIIKDSVNRLQKLIEDLLDFNIVLDSTSLQDSEKFSFSSVLTPVIEQRKLDIKRKQLTIDCQLLPISLNGNVKQLNVVLDNLLSNAIKYSPNNSKIIIKNQLSDGMMQLSITDNGPGLTTQATEKIFEAFYQGPAPENSQIKGSGLGLTIVKELMMRLNGDITIKNRADNTSGVVAQVILPRAFKEKH